MQLHLEFTDYGWADVKWREKVMKDLRILLIESWIAKSRIGSLKKKFKDKSFARNVNRERIKYYERLDLEFEDFLQVSLEALQKVAVKLEL